MQCFTYFCIIYYSTALCKRVYFRYDIIVNDYYKLVKIKRLGRLMSTSF